MRVLSMAALVCAPTLFGERARAQDRATSVRFEAIGPGCPSEEAFRRDLHERTPTNSDPLRTLVVRLRPASTGFEGTVEAVEGPGAESWIVASRTVHGETCEDVASAALLLVALGSLKARAPAPPVPSADAMSTRPPAPPAPPPAPSAGWVAVHVAGLGSITGGIGPLAVGGGARVGLALEGGDLWRPELRAGLDAFADAGIQTPLGTATRSLVAARVDVCPFGAGPPRTVVKICAAGAAGELRVSGQAVSDSKDEGRLYTALGGLVRARLRIVAGLAAEISAGVMAPLASHRFFFRPDTTVLALDRPVPFGELGLAWSIP